MKESRVLLLIVLCLCLIVFGQNQDSTAKNNVQELTKEERILGLVQIYSTAKQHFAYFERLGDLDWDKAFKEYLPAVEKDQSLLEYYRTLQRFIALLQDGHTNVYLPKQIENRMDRLPLKIEYIQDQWVVTERFPVKEVLEEDIPVGSVVLKIEGLDANAYIEQNFFPYLAHGTIQGKRTAVNYRLFFQEGQEVKIAVKYPDGGVRDRTVFANRKTVRWTNELQGKYTPALRQGPDFGTKKLEDNILYIRYRECRDGIQKEFCKLILNMNVVPDAMIIDLRGNPGGNTPQQAVSHLVSSPFRLYQFKTRWSISYIDAQMSSQEDEAHKKAVLESKRTFMELPDKMNTDWFVISDGKTELPPAERSYTGRLVILIDNETGSAAEDMVVLLHGAGRATVIGEPSAGSTGQPLMIPLPGGGSARICTANVKYPDGKEFVGVGIQPDIAVNRTIEGIAKGQDEILDAAVKFFQQ